MNFINVRLATYIRPTNPVIINGQTDAIRRSLKVLFMQHASSCNAIYQTIASTYLTRKEGPQFIN